MDRHPCSRGMPKSSLRNCAGSGGSSECSSSHTLGVHKGDKLQCVRRQVLPPSLRPVQRRGCAARWST
eukprot:12881142-Prorocentrum_lima.AAC.1